MDFDMRGHDENSRIAYILPFFLLASIVTVGCGGSADEGPQVVAVTGTVTINGAPVKGAGVSFRPDESQGNKTGFIPGGTTDAAGKYELSATASKKGAPPGWYKVVVMPPSAPPGSDKVVEVPEYNAKFQDPAKTDLVFEVKESSEPLVFDIQLTK